MDTSFFRKSPGVWPAASNGSVHFSLQLAPGLQSPAGLAPPPLNEQMWPGPWSLCQQRTGGQPQLVGIPQTREGERQKKARESSGGCVWKKIHVKPGQETLEVTKYAKICWEMGTLFKKLDIRFEKNYNCRENMSTFFPFMVSGGCIKHYLFHVTVLWGITHVHPSFLV